MAQGLLEVSGTIDLDQFWPIGESDADAVKVLVSGPDAFQFRAHPDLPAKVTHAFEGRPFTARSSSRRSTTRGATIRL